jgi:hypothetical protein
MWGPFTVGIANGPRAARAGGGGATTFPAVYHASPPANLMLLRRDEPRVGPTRHESDSGVCVGRRGEAPHPDDRRVQSLRTAGTEATITATAMIKYHAASMPRSYPRRRGANPPRVHDARTWSSRYVDRSTSSR